MARADNGLDRVVAKTSTPRQLHGSEHRTRLDAERVEQLREPTVQVETELGDRRIGEAGWPTSKISRAA
jgi:hypothetical protein